MQVRNLDYAIQHDADTFSAVFDDLIAATGRLKINETNSLSYSQFLNLSSLFKKAVIQSDKAKKKFLFAIAWKEYLAIMSEVKKVQETHPEFRNLIDKMVIKYDLFIIYQNDQLNTEIEKFPFDQVKQIFKEEPDDFIESFSMTEDENEEQEKIFNQPVEQDLYKRFLEPLKPGKKKEVIFNVMRKYNEFSGISYSQIGIPCQTLASNPNIFSQIKFPHRQTFLHPNKTKSKGIPLLNAKSVCIIGAIPTVAMLLNIPENELIDIYSTVDYFELSHIKYIKPVDCHKYGWGHTILPWTDYSKGKLPMEAVNVLKMAARMLESKSRGRIPFVHCKTGAGRSVTIATTYVALLPETPGATKGEKLRNAILIVNGSRDEADLHDEFLDEVAQQTGKTWDELLENDAAELKSLNLSVYKKTEKLRLCYQAIHLYQNLENDPQLKSIIYPMPVGEPKNYSTNSHHFHDCFVQSAPFKELQMIAWQKDKTISSRIQAILKNGHVSINKSDNMG